MSTHEGIGTSNKMSSNDAIQRESLFTYNKKIIILNLTIKYLQKDSLLNSCIYKLDYRRYRYRNHEAVLRQA